jgi:large subunit ribosomal protein L18e
VPVVRGLASPSGAVGRKSRRGNAYIGSPGRSTLPRMDRTMVKGDPELVRTLIELRKAARRHEAPIWAAVAERLARARHSVPPVNVGDLERLASAKETIIVPGKLLSHGEISKPLTIAAYRWSGTAAAKVAKAGGRTITIHELLHNQPDGAGVRIIV